ncbi:hypothetical protein PS623_04362 [Pseudomonas fluorescens]|nr:hypothetical protein PS623_04362 [Pseudomonas fluorescens]
MLKKMTLLVKAATPKWKVYFHLPNNKTLPIRFLKAPQAIPMAVLYKAWPSVL